MFQPRFRRSFLPTEGCLSSVTIHEAGWRYRKNIEVIREVNKNILILIVLLIVFRYFQILY